MLNCLLTNIDFISSFSGDKNSILSSNTELSRMVKAEKYIIQNPHLDVDNFELLVRFIETKFIRFHGSKHGLEMLEIATSFQCQDLEIACAKDLDLTMASENVLAVFRALRYYSSTKVTVNLLQPSKMSMASSEEYLASLLYNSLQFIDMNADEIFKQPEMMELRFEELEMIVKRDALQIASEISLINLLAEWSFQECHRKLLEVTFENRRRVLGGLCYQIRYLTLSGNDFKSACARVELLDDGEIQLMQDYYDGKKSLNSEQKENIDNFKQPRPKFALMPVYLSERSNPKNYPKRMRKAHKDAHQDQKDRGCCDRMILDCCSVFACIFE